MYTFKSYVLQQKYKLNKRILLTQEPTFVILMVVTQQPIIRKNAATHAFQILEWFTIRYHHHVKPSYTTKSFKENQCIVAWGHATSQVEGNVELQKDHILFIFPIPFVTLFLSYPSIKPLIFTTFIINMGLYYHFPNHLFLSILSEFVVNYLEK